MFHVEAPCPVHLPFVEAGMAQRLAVGAGAAGGLQFNDSGHGDYSWLLTLRYRAEVDVE